MNSDAGPAGDPAVEVDTDRGLSLIHILNMSQSSNDTFPTAMHIAAAVELEDKLFPALDALAATFRRLQAENADVVKSGRTHLQDAVPITLGQEISGWRNMLEKDRAMLELSLPGLHLSLIHIFRVCSTRSRFFSR